MMRHDTHTHTHTHTKITVTAAFIRSLASLIIDCIGKKPFFYFLLRPLAGATLLHSEYNLRGPLEHNFARGVRGSLVLHYDDEGPCESSERISWSISIAILGRKANSISTHSTSKQNNTNWSRWTRMKRCGRLTDSWSYPDERPRRQLAEFECEW